MDEVVIGSADACVVLSRMTAVDAEGWRRYRVTLQGSGLTASRVVSDYVRPEPEAFADGATGLERLFRETADEYRGWDGAKEWESMEAQFRVSATSDRTGHATLEMKLFEKVGGWGWDARIAVVLDVVERDRVAKALRSFFRPL